MATAARYIFKSRQAAARHGCSGSCAKAARARWAWGHWRPPALPKRAKADACRRLLADDLDPLAHRDAAKADRSAIAHTFKDVAARYRAVSRAARVFLVVFICFTGRHSSAITFEQYEEQMRKSGLDKSSIQAYVLGILHGFLTANQHYKDQHMPVMFCLPEHLSLQYEQLRSISQQYLMASPGYSNPFVDIAYLLELSLAYTFPCAVTQSGKSP